MAKGTIGERVYRRLLRLYPRDFSDDYADEMTHLYRDRVRGEGASRVWLALVADLSRTAPREQMSTLVQDVRYAWRTWRRTPILALAAVLTLALGVGANTAVFSVVHGVLLRPLQYPDADRLVEVRSFPRARLLSSSAQTASSRRSCRRSAPRCERSTPLSRSRICAVSTSGSAKPRNSRD
jgi:hypothetical protein